jgi:predicted ATP-dependent endonuclease of OLD family
MLIRNVEIKNYRSLKNIKVNAIGNLVILVGKNSSGKTNFLEALWLFFKDFSLIPETNVINSPIAANELMWYEGDTDVPITFTMEIELNDKESKRVFPPDFLRAFDANEVSVFVEREIVATPPNMSWNTQTLSCSGVVFIENGKDVSPHILETDTSSSENPSTQASRKSKEPQKKAIVISKERTRKTTQQKVALSSLKAEDVQKMAKNLEAEIRGKAQYIQASRNKPSTFSNYAIRTAISDDITNAKIVEIGESLSTKIRRKWRQFQGDFENFSPYGQRLNVVKSQPIVDETDLSVPLSLVGGGTQEVIAIIRHIIEDEKPIVLIEEPESHLHPELAKKLFKYLKRLSRRKQVWISTQSPFFLDRDEIDNTVNVSREGNQTKILRLVDKVELKKAIFDLGVKPSDFLFADAILLVDGLTEEDVIPIWAKTLRVNLDELGVFVLAIRGGEKGRYNLKMWREITKSAQIPIFFLLDSHASNEVDECIRQGLIERDRCVVLSVASIEETYPKKHVLKAIADEWGVQLSSSDLQDTKADTIRTALEEGGMTLDGNWWKPPLGRRVAEMMKTDEIPNDARRLIERIKLVLT